jgi:hypothetical protein
MGSFIAAGQAYIAGIINTVQKVMHEKHHKKADFRVAFIAYRDFGDSGQLNVTGFTRDVEACKQKVNSERASGGGDTPEDVCGAFHMASTLDWRERSANFMILICDAPCHNTPTKKFHSYDERWSDLETSDRKGRRGYLDPDVQLVNLREKHKVNVMITEMSTGSVTDMISMFEVIQMCGFDCSKRANI